MGAEPASQIARAEAPFAQSTVIAADSTGADLGTHCVQHQRRMVKRFALKERYRLLDGGAIKGLANVHDAR